VHEETIAVLVWAVQTTELVDKQTLAEQGCVLEITVSVCGEHPVELVCKKTSLTS
jgi:hypothetical protein